jgi:gliding motility-associated-like protein
MFAYVSKSQVDAGEDISISAGLPVMVQGNYTGYTGIGVTAEDDAFVGPFEIGFEFTYFGETFNRFAVGPNGLLSFDVPGIIGESPNDPVAIPTGVYPKTILGPYQDMFSRPAPPHSNYIFYRTVGEAPNRKLILGWCEAPMYICDENKISCQIVLEETTNKIMNHIIAKPECFPHYGNNATQGLNMSSNLGVPVTGRNNTSWTATYESWECIPDGDNNYSITQIEFEPEVIIPTGKLSFAWYKDSYPGGELVSNEANAVVYPTASASYFCEISLCSGVTYVDELKVNVIPIPNAFNPNSNVLENRIFKVFANPVEGVSNFTMYIYDRWGKLMFETSKINEGWDGTSNGSNCATGVYVWVIYYKEGNEELTNKGMVTLVR